MYRDKLYIVYIIISIVSLFFLIISLNGLLFHNQYLINLIPLKSLGNWQYWILIASTIVFIYFAYMTYSILNDISTFKKLLKSSSKKTFIDNMPSLERISKRLGKNYDELLKQAKHKWGIKK
ncbi:DUF3198 domain-containing protein [Ferroplasma acidiphilum]|uniref:DUF3198 domain-containing protein n=1 Tax=Ferroplasma acidiphilum TaxID=74969 RepID=UPI0023F3704E|nr:DUF3198 domain-containing protein [Ferroplasma acidiphilum]MCL4349221.1 DUF3198 domain-containing protein [Candidatus Thermoplasmatota archaeon]